MKRILLLGSVTFIIFLSANIFAQETIFKLPTTDNTSSFNITKSDDGSLFKLNADGGFYLNGTYGTGTIPISGEGTRLIWYPKKAAFRAGSVSGDQWDDANIGLYSTAMGGMNKASAYGSVALGYGNYATDQYSLALGYSSDATGEWSTAIGRNAVASGEASTAIGAENTASGPGSFTQGYLTLSSGRNTVAMGTGTKAEAMYATAIGKYNIGGGTADTWVATESIFEIGIGADNANRANAVTVLKNGKTGIGTATPEFKLSVDNDGGIIAKGTYDSGNTLTTSGAGTRLIWYPKKAAFRAGYVDNDWWDDANIGLMSFAAGGLTIASAYGSVALGNGAQATGIGSVALGTSTGSSGVYSMATGNHTYAIGDNSMTMGYGILANSYLSVAMGRFNVGGGTTDSWVATDPLFEIGIGADGANKANAVTVLKNGNMTIAGSLTENSDIRFKENINPLNSVLSSLNDIEPVYYEFKDKRTHPEGRHIGLIAQEVEEAFPELVTEDSQGYKSVEYTKLTAVLLQAIKELKAEKDELERRLEKLEK